MGNGAADRDDCLALKEVKSFQGRELGERDKIPVLRKQHRARVAFSRSEEEPEV